MSMSSALPYFKQTVGGVHFNSCFWAIDHLNFKQAHRSSPSIIGATESPIGSISMQLVFNAMGKLSMFLMLFVACLGGPFYNSVSALDNAEGQTPPMGFNDWNELAAHYPPWKNGLNESDVLAIARAMVEFGLRDAGYSFVNLDCGYSAGAKNSGKPLAVDENRFPRGLKTLGQEIHSMGLKFGIYSSGRQCCDGNVRLGMESLDAKTFASWGVDYVKYDDWYCIYVCMSGCGSVCALVHIVDATATYLGLNSS
eukprot:m.363841 g.363841  ORF g.363841 m.363841 type:complete len:254 (-) comp20805_c0_seq1:129-890(-)